MAIGIEWGKEALSAGKGIIGGLAGLALGGWQDRRQIKQQRKIGELQIAQNKEMLEAQREKEMQMWHDTNIVAQRKELEDANMNPALLYGGKGAGGTTTTGSGGMNITGATADGGSQRAQLAIQSALQMAQVENIKADTEKKKAETANTGATQASTEWNTELSKKLNNDPFIADIQSQQSWASQQIELKFAKENAEWEALMAGGFEGKTFDDPSSPMAKAFKAGFERTVTEANNAKTTGDVLTADKTIKEFEAKLTRQGITPGSPWYVKIMGDLLGKVGINLNQKVADHAKK